MLLHKKGTTYIILLSLLRNSWLILCGYTSDCATHEKEKDYHEIRKHEKNISNLIVYEISFFDRINRINKNHACLCDARRQVNLVHPVREVLPKAAKFISMFCFVFSYLRVFVIDFK